MVLYQQHYCNYEIPTLLNDNINLTTIGREYFFGGGIQNEDPAWFRQMKGLHPFQTIELGNTTVTKTMFDRWCDTMMSGGGRYSPYSYDLLTRNCNHFCHEALSVLGVDQSYFPAWILDVPIRFLSSPMGQMVRPMLENMQITTTTTTASPPPPPGVMGASTTAAAAARTNPWATTAAVATTTTTSPTAKVGPPTTITPAKTTTRTTAALDALTQPLLSNDTQTVRLCVTKITDAIVTCNTTAEENEEYGDATNAYCLLKRLAQDIERGDTKRIVEYQSELCRVVQWALEKNLPTTFTLMLARIVVLHDRTSSSSSSSSQLILEWIRDHWRTLSGNAKVTAWLVIGNILGRRCHPPPPVVGVVVVDDWIMENAVADLSHENVAVRQAVAAVLYNASLLLTKNNNNSSKNDGNSSNNNDDDNDDEQVIDDSTVSILCILLEEETDATTRERRYMAAGKWLRASRAARTLAHELGLADHLLLMVTAATGTGQKSPLVDDIVSLLMP
jgi:PPPDE putative peptidase domain